MFNIMKIHRNSAWSKEQISSYLDRVTSPLRISYNDVDGYPNICSLWFFHQDGALWSASHKNSHLIKTLTRKPKIAFEVATNEYPYHGVRGKADAVLVKDDGADILEKVIDKYLATSNNQLADWLLSRKHDEYAIKISPLSVNAWDFSNRMNRN